MHQSRLYFNQFAIRRYCIVFDKAFIIYLVALKRLNNSSFLFSVQRLNTVQTIAKVESHSIHSINFSITLVQWGANSLYKSLKKLN